jgi:adenosylmethionine-8-amino-7-oxononanoate aminotransferase
MTQTLAGPASAVAPVGSGPRTERPTVSHAKGVWIWDTDGRAYLDGCSGAIVANIGHGVPEVLDAMRRQAAKCTFSYRTQFSNAPAELLADRLRSIAPDDLTSVTFVNSGSEANEAAWRMAVQYWRLRGEPGKRKMLGRRGSYHGMTLGALSVSGHPGRREAMTGLLHDYPRVRSPHLAGTGRDLIAEWDEVIQRADPHSVAAIIVEPVIGAAGGAIPSPPGHLADLRALCDRYGILLVADEVMTGLGRTGRWFASTRDDTTPDMITLGKGLSAGYTPMAAVLATREIELVITGDDTERIFGHTYSGNPLGAATCLAVLDFTQRNDLLHRARTQGQRLRLGLDELHTRHPLIHDVRGEGLLLGLELDASASSAAHLTSRQAVTQLVDAAFDRGLLIYPAGSDEHPDAVLIAPPLTITDDDIGNLIVILDAALTATESRLRAI